MEVRKYGTKPCKVSQLFNMKGAIEKSIQALTRFKPRLGTILRKYIESANKEVLAGNCEGAWPLYVIALLALQNASEENEAEVIPEPEEDSARCEPISYSCSANESNRVSVDSISASRLTNSSSDAADDASATDSSDSVSYASALILAVLDAIESDVISTFMEFTTMLMVSI